MTTDEEINKRKWFYYSILVVASGIVLSIVLLLAIAGINNLKASGLAKTLQHVALPEQTIVIEVLSGCGNVSGTGNRTSVWAGMLVGSNLSDTEVYDYFKFYHIYKTSRYAVNRQQWPT